MSWSSDLQGRSKSTRKELNKSMELDMLNPKVLRELADVLLLRLGEDFYVWKKANVALIFKRCPKDSQRTTGWSVPF